MKAKRLTPAHVRVKAYPPDAPDDFTVCSWSDFCRENEGLDLAAIARVLDSGHAYTGGGGASPEFRIEKVTP